MPPYYDEKDKRLSLGAISCVNEQCDTGESLCRAVNRLGRDSSEGLEFQVKVNLTLWVGLPRHCVRSCYPATLPSDQLQKPRLSRN